MAYSQGGGKKKVCYYYDGERPGRQEGGWAGLRRQARSRAEFRGRRREWAPVLRGGKEEGPTFGRILTHSRPDAVRWSPSAARGPRGLCSWSQVDAPFSLLPLSLRQYCPPPQRRPACGTVPAYPVFVEVAKGMACLLSSPARHLAGVEVWGCPASAPTPPPGSK